jgi:hypothetical protein
MKKKIVINFIPGFTIEKFRLKKSGIIRYIRSLKSAFEGNKGSLQRSQARKIPTHRKLMEK